MFKKLLIPLDRSPLAEQAVGQAMAIARASKASIDLVFVHQPFPFGGFSDVPWDADSPGGERSYLEAVAGEITSGSSVPTTHAVLRGEPVDMICRRIGDVDADLVVMTTHGRTGLSRAWMGSIADGVLRHSSVPVLLLRPIEGKSRRDAAHHLFKHMLITVDGSTQSTEVIGAAAALADCDGAKISLLRVVQPVPLVMPDPGMPFAFIGPVADAAATNQVVLEAREQMETLAGRLRAERSADVTFQVVIDARIGHAIIDFARGHQVDVIAMATHGNGVTRYLIGSVADKVLRGSELPMLLYRPLGVQAREHLVEVTAGGRAPELTIA